MTGIDERSEGEMASGDALRDDGVDGEGSSSLGLISPNTENIGFNPAEREDSNRKPASETRLAPLLGTIFLSMDVRQRPVSGSKINPFLLSRPTVFRPIRPQIPPFGGILGRRFARFWTEIPPCP